MKDVDNQKKQKPRPQQASEAQANIQAVTSVLRALRRTRTKHDAARVALESVRAAFGWSYGSYWEIDTSSNLLRFSIDSGQVSQEFRDVTLKASFARGVGVSGRAWAKADLLVIGDLGQVTDCVRAPAARSAGVKSGVCLPISVDDEIVGTMDFFALERIKLSEARIEALRNVGEIVSSTLERIREEERQREQAEDAQAVTQVLEAMGRAETVDAMAEATLEAVRAAFSWSYGSYWTRDRKRDELHFTAESGEVSSAFRRVTREAAFERGTGVNGRAWSTGELVVVDDLGEVTDCVRAPVARQAGIRSGVCFPVIVRGEVIATMDFFSTKAVKVSKARGDALRSVARLVSAAAERIADRDAFTSSLQEFSRGLDATVVGLASTISEQSAAAQELATSVGQVTATLSELRHTSSETLDQAERVIAQAHRSADTSNEGTEAVERAVGSMREIRDQVSQIAERILTLSDQTSQVGNIIASVTEIAAQSKLLALNAAIEAARAGEHGRGFGVVATEIGSLAEQSRDATAQVRQILGQIQGGTNSAVVSTEEGTKKVEIGMALADLSGQNIHKLSRAIVESSESARLIANSARQQNAGIQEVAEALLVISTATNGAAASLRQTEEATAQLAGLNARMQRLLAQYAPRPQTYAQAAE